MTGDGSSGWLSPDDAFADFGEKVRRGYDPEIVDRHLEQIAAGIKSLRREVESSESLDDESLQVMMRAGRRSVEEALEEAHEKSDNLVAEAEKTAAATVAEAHQEATSIRAKGEEDARLQEETIEIRRIEITALDEEIELRQKALRAAASELLRLADGIIDDEEIDLRASDSARQSEADDPVSA